MDVEEWQLRAPCATNLYPDAWFPESRLDYYALKAKRICALSCQVRLECEAAGATERHGIWGGTYRSESTQDTAGLPDDKVPALGTRRRLQALAATGWTSKEVAADVRRYTGLVINPRRLDAVRNDTESFVPQDVAGAVARSVKHFNNRSGTGITATNLMLIAAENHWPSPRAWRGLDIEDPEVYPSVA